MGVLEQEKRMLLQEKKLLVTTQVVCHRRHRRLLVELSRALECRRHDLFRPAEDLGKRIQLQTTSSVSHLYHLCVS